MGLNTTSDYSANNSHKGGFNDDELEEETLPTISPVENLSSNSSSQGGEELNQKTHGELVSPFVFFCFLKAHLM